MDPTDGLSSLISAGLTTAISVNLLIMLFLLERYIYETTTDEQRPYLFSVLILDTALVAQLSSLIFLILSNYDNSFQTVFGTNTLTISLILFVFSLSLILGMTIWLSTVIIRFK